MIQAPTHAPHRLGRTRTTLVVLLGVAMIAAATLALWPISHTTKPKILPPLIATIHVHRGTVVVRSAVVATATEAMALTVIPATSGQVSSIAVALGQKVTAGQTLMVLTNPALDAQVSQAEANVVSAQAKLQQAKPNANQASNQAALAQAHNQVVQAQQSLQQIAASTSPQSVAITNAHELLEFTESPASPQQVSVTQAQLAITQLQAIPVTDQTTNYASQLAQAEAVLAQAQASLKGTIIAEQASLSLAEAQKNAALNAAQSAVVSSQDNGSKLQSTLDDAVTSPSELSSLQAGVQAAEAALTAAQAAQDSLIITSPVSGVVTTLNTTLGQNVSPSAVLMTVGASMLQLTATVPVSQLGAVHPGTQVEAVGSTGDRTTVSLTSITPSPATPVLDIIDLGVPTPNRLQSGQNWTVFLPQQSQTGIIIPNSALIAGPGNDGTVDVIRHQLLSPVHVVIKLQGANHTVISGIAPDALVANPANGAFGNHSKIRTYGG